MSEPKEGAPNLITQIDKLIHEPARLSILANLYVIKSCDFTFLLRQAGLTWGNLSSHLSKLEQAGYVDIQKEFVDKKPRTTLSLTSAGRAAFQDYRRQMDQVLSGLPD